MDVRQALKDTEGIAHKVRNALVMLEDYSEDI